MRKANKIMIMTVSVLLTLVLFTSTALSGTLAKYVSSDSMSATARVAKWGVNIDVSVDTTKLSKVCPDTISKVTVDRSGTNASVEIKGLKMGPGDNLDDVIKFSFSGQPEVKVIVKLIVAVSYTQDHFAVDAGVGNLAKKRDLLPVGFRFSAMDSSGTHVVNNFYVATPFRDSTGNSTELTIVKEIAKKIDVTYKDTTDDYVWKEFEPNLPVVFAPKSGSGSVTQFGFGFFYPLTYSRTYDEVALDTDEIGTWLAKNKSNSIFSVRYTLSIEQITE